MSHLLVVEDDPVSSRILVNLLQKRGHEAHVASGVNEAITALERNTLVDLVILDNQLQGEYGWQFLEYVRRDFIFRNLPVLIYTGSSDRNSVLKYLQLGVQKILVKPYNAGQIESELTRAVQFDWRGMVFEPAERVCQRLNITEDEYYKSLMRGATDVKDHVPAMNKLVGSRDLRVFDEHLSALQSIALNLGVSLLENAVESIQVSLREGKLDQCIYFVNRLVPTARLMHHRALSHFGMSKGGEFPRDLFDEPREDKSAKKSEEKVPGTRPVKQDPLDTMIQSPLGAFAEDFRLLLARRVFEKGEVVRQVSAPGAAVGVDDILESLRFLRNMNSVPVGAMSAFIRQIPGLESKLVTIANGISTRTERVLLLEQALEVMGANMACCIAIPLEWLRASRRGRNPLRLELMARYDMARALLVRELAIKFKGTQEFAAAALTCGVGSWLLAVQYPAFFGMTLVLARESPADLLKFERDLFSTDHRELAATFAKGMGFPETVVATAQHLDDPSASPSGEPQIVGAMVNLADILARIRSVGFPGVDTQLTDEDFARSPAWETLRANQVQIPLDPPEYLTALSSVVERVRGVVEMAFE
jgi:CheY-like chemotaxis protein